MTLKHLAAALSDSHDLPKKQAEAVLGDLVTLATRHLKKGDKIRLTGLGVFQVRKRAARMGRNPATGEAIKIKASKKVAFRVAKELKEAVYSEDQAIRFRRSQPPPWQRSSGGDRNGSACRRSETQKGGSVHCCNFAIVLWFNNLFHL